MKKSVFLNLLQQYFSGFESLSEVLRQHQKEDPFIPSLIRLIQAGKSAEVLSHDRAIARSTPDNCLAGS